VLMFLPGWEHAILYPHRLPSECQDCQVFPLVSPTASRNASTTRAPCVTARA
jgi:hypothetical protein